MVVRRRHRHVIRRKHRKRGSGLWDALKSAHNWIKSNKIISTVGNALGKVGVPYAGAIGTAAGTLGYGRGRKVGRPRRVGRPRLVAYRPPVRVPRVYAGGSLRSILSGAHRFVRDRKLVSGALSHFGHPKLASVATSLGYGRRRRVRRYRPRGSGGTQQMGALRF